MPAGQQRLSRKGPSADGPKLGHRLSRPRDGDVLALSHPVYDLTAMVPEFANRDLSHFAIVSRVRHIAAPDDPDDPADPAAP